MQEELNAALGSLEGYVSLILMGLGFMLGAMLVVFLLYRVVTSLIKPTGKFARMVLVAFGAIYVLILVLAVLLAAERFGFDVGGFAGVIILAVIVGAVVVFFAIPFLPRLPFKIGDMVSIRGTMGIVEGITTYQTVLRTFDGRLVYIPNVIVLGSDIQNFSAVPTRRVELSVQVHTSDDIEVARGQMLDAMQSDARVLSDPAPAVFVTDMDTGIVSLLGLCWVANADWFPTRDALIVDVARRINAAEGVRLVERELNLRSDNAGAAVPSPDRG